MMTEYYNYKQMYNTAHNIETTLRTRINDNVKVILHRGERAIEITIDKLLSAFVAVGNTETKTYFMDMEYINANGQYGRVYSDNITNIDLIY